MKQKCKMIIGPVVVLSLFFIAGSCRKEVPVPFAIDLMIPVYNPPAADALSGILVIKGSNTLIGSLTILADEFSRIHKDVRIQIEGRGSDSGPEALLDGSAQIAAMSRPLYAEEITALKKKIRVSVREYPIARDAIAVYVHRDNPLKALSMEELKLIFSSRTESGHYGQESRNGQNRLHWSDFGVQGRLGDMVPVTIGRADNSGTRQVFSDSVQLDDRAQYSLVFSGSSALIRAIENDRAAIGYSGIGYATAGVRKLALKYNDYGAVEPDQESVKNGTYPLSRLLFLVIPVADPGTKDKLPGQFLRFVYSREGQALLAETGFFPLDAIEIKQVSEF